jgi:hypothetical protein
MSGVLFSPRPTSTAKGGDAQRHSVCSPSTQLPTRAQQRTPTSKRLTSTPHHITDLCCLQSRDAQRHLVHGRSSTAHTEQQKHTTTMSCLASVVSKAGMRSDIWSAAPTAPTTSSTAHTDQQSTPPQCHVSPPWSRKQGCAATSRPWTNSTAHTDLEEAHKHTTSEMLTSTPHTTHHNTDLRCLKSRDAQRHLVCGPRAPLPVLRKRTEDKRVLQVAASYVRGTRMRCLVLE